MFDHVCNYMNNRYIIQNFPESSTKAFWVGTAGAQQIGI